MSRSALPLPLSSAVGGQLIVDEVSFAYGPTTILHRVSVTVGEDDRLGLIGYNGSGKSTLLRLMAGLLVPDTGRVLCVPPELSVGLMTQRLDDEDDDTVSRWLDRRSGLSAVMAEFEAATAALARIGSADGRTDRDRGDEGRIDGDQADDAAAADRYDRALQRYVAAAPDEAEARRAKALDDVGLAALDPETPTRHLSGGQRTKLNLASIGLSVHHILLLDEPTNDLDGDGLEGLAAMVDGRRGGLVVVSHDRAFLEATITSVLELDGHARTASLYRGGFEAWQTERERARQREQQRYQDYVSARSDIEERIDRTQRWSASGTNRARRMTRADESDKFIRSGKIRGAEMLGAKAGRAQKALDRLDRNQRVDKPHEPWVLRLRFAEAERSAERVATLRAAVVKLGSFTLGPVDVDIAMGDRVLITGANGSGKTTLLRALLGEQALESGAHHLATNVRVGRLDQRRSELGGSESTDLLDGFRSATGLIESEARSQLAKLGLGADMTGSSFDRLSPGEQTRAILGVFAATGTNLLVLDEPTNHLDLEAIEQLELALEHVGGTVLLVSHDRRLIENVIGGSDHPVRRLEVEAGSVTERTPPTTPTTPTG